MKTSIVCKAVFLVSLLYFVTIVLLVILHEIGNNGPNKLDKVGNDIVLISNEIIRHKTKTSTVKRDGYRTKQELMYTIYGPGENGSAVVLPDLNLSFLETAERNKMHDFNTLISDVINLHRKVPDLRPSDCKKIVYPENMPPITIVTIFRDEWWSILLRTVYSVLEMAPTDLIYEVIIVDDGSINQELVTMIKLHVNHLNKVRFIQNKVPRGLMMARQAGIDAVKSDMFMVMDGHMEVGPGWLEPLIHRLTQKPKALLCSHVGGINQHNFEISVSNNKPDEKHFDEQFPFFDHVNLDQMFATFKPEYREARNHSVKPIPYGTIQGMMIVMRKDFFQQLGGFDPGMKVWGSEQMELSVKVWMCGGVVEMVPCSTVAHMYRRTPWGGAKDDEEDFISLNKARMSDVWMDPPFSDTLSNYLSDKNYTVGDLSSRREIRTRNQCKPYKYFLDQVQSFSDVYIPRDIKRQGSIQNHLFKRCLDLLLHVLLHPCHNRINFNQYFILTESNQIRGNGGHLLDVVTENDDVIVTLRHSPSVWTAAESEWRLDDNKIVNIHTGFCLTALTQDSIGLKPCSDSPSQMWTWESVGNT